ncbi:MAG: sigma 54-interacting transcriptional regulator, partial [Nitrospirae bacterium]|nr:sigma 54-interacting transcriptional regulator [Nitrospirota bacterium]
RVGGGKTIRVNVRLIVATHTFLEEAVRKGTFREDLFYRINVVPIHLPSLRDRALDIPDLVRHFMGKYNRLFRKEVVKITDSAMQILTQHAWPGNIRELENLIERLIAVSDDDVISQEDIPLEYYLLNPPESSDSRDPSRNLLQTACDTFERNFILKIMEREQWSRKRTAEVLGVPLSTLKFKCNRLQINEILSEKSFSGPRRGRPRVFEGEGANILT